MAECMTLNYRARFALRWQGPLRHGLGRHRLWTS